MPENGEGDAWEAASVMLGPVKVVAFYDTDGHGPECLLARAAAWFADPVNRDWGIMDIVFSQFARTQNGVIQGALTVYVQDRANQVAPVQVLDEPFMEIHRHMYEEVEREMTGLAGMQGMMIDPRWLTGTRTEAIAKLEEHGVPGFLIELLLPEREGE